MAGWNIVGNVKDSVDAYIGGAGAAAAAHYADQAAPVGFLSNRNVSNGEALLGAVIVGDALFGQRLHGRSKRYLQYGTAYAAGSLMDSFLKGRFGSIGSGQPTTGSTVTGAEIMDPSGDWGGSPSGGGAPVSFDSASADESATGLGLD